LGYYNKYDKGVQTSFNSDRTMIEITLNMLAAGDIAQEFKTRVAFRYL